MNTERYLQKNKNSEATGRKTSEIEKKQITRRKAAQREEAEARGVLTVAQRARGTEESG